ncbi:hypothetical protein [Spirosoma montaniterrae]|uniref:Uncharacterized protein n=1 Tax=Spirosoma montaniterrae TaxID=1178516 RepID=A0A1P9WT13_9BACT|nr:hypothetical protein [Spirosoma montaniterrae]AQG78480.1 hypothetical protein AWR27_03470 [Spirosoma montaniterrae]
MTYPFTLIAPVLPHKRTDLLRLLEQMARELDCNPVLPFDRLAGVHFGRVMLIDADSPGFAPLLSMETNFDGDESAHLADLAQTAGPGLAELFSHCEGFTGNVLTFLQTHRKKTAAFYQGHPYRSREQILQEQALQQNIRDFLDANTASLAGLTQRSIRERIQQHIKSQPDFAWAVQNRGLSAVGLWWQQHRGLLGIYATLALLFSVAGALMPDAPEFAVPTALRVWLCALVGVLFAMLATGIRKLSLRLVVAVVLAGLLSCLLRVGCAFLYAVLLAGGLGLILRYGVVSWWFWALNKREAADKPERIVSEGERLPRLLAVEDLTTQNQLTHLVRLKPYSFRCRSLKVVLTAIDLLAKLLYNKGNLGGIPTIHFARWVLIDNDQRLLFNSNYDGSWESYLGDFTDKAAEGLTAVWSHTINFPKACDLTEGGARDEQRFKKWARAHQLPTQVWYSAYPELSVPNVNNNSRIRDGLFCPLSDAALARWFRRL